MAYRAAARRPARGRAGGSRAPRSYAAAQPAPSAGSSSRRATRSSSLGAKVRSSSLSGSAWRRSARAGSRRQRHRLRIDRGNALLAHDRFHLPAPQARQLRPHAHARSQRLRRREGHEMPEVVLGPVAEDRPGHLRIGQDRVAGPGDFGDQPVGGRLGVAGHAFPRPVGSFGMQDGVDVVDLGSQRRRLGPAFTERRQLVRLVLAPRGQMGQRVLGGPAAIGRWRRPGPRVQGGEDLALDGAGLLEAFDQARPEVGRSDLGMRHRGMVPGRSGSRPGDPRRRPAPGR